MKSSLSFFKREKVASGEAKRRAIIVHNHIFKNAGSSIDWALGRNFGEGFIDHRDDLNMRRGAEYFGPFLQENGHIVAVSSHHLTLPLPAVDNTVLLSLMMFRHPIERVSSVYHYERKQVTASTPGAIHARELELDDYIVWRMRPDVGRTIRNFHAARSLPPIKPRQAISESMVTDARNQLMTTPMLGLVEKFDESMVLFEEVLSTYHPTIDLSYTRQNVNQDTKQSSEDRIAAMRKVISDSTYQLLMENNAVDMRLYEFCRGVFDERVEKVVDFDRKLADFRQRCMNNQ